jgi:hypothetical protein
MLSFDPGPHKPFFHEGFLFIEGHKFSEMGVGREFMAQEVMAQSSDECVSFLLLEDLTPLPGNCIHYVVEEIVGGDLGSFLVKNSWLNPCMVCKWLRVFARTCPSFSRGQ